MKVKWICTFGSSLFISCFCIPLFAQSSLSQWRSHLREDSSFISASFRLIPPVDSTKSGGVQFAVSFSPAEDEIYIFLPASGGIVAFEDSFRKKPILAEKLKLFPFQALRPGILYKMLVFKSLKESGYLEIQLHCESLGGLVDEIFLCLPWTFQRVILGNGSGKEGIKYRKLP